jgi:hypothetical protein
MKMEMAYSHAQVGQTMNKCFVTEQYNKIIDEAVY